MSDWDAFRLQLFTLAGLLDSWMVTRGCWQVFHHVILFNMAANCRSTATASTPTIEIISFVRGFHACKDIWHPSVGDTCILDLKREPTNLKDALAVCIQKNGTVVETQLPCSPAEVAGPAHLILCTLP